ncbi:hypothetical protein OsJ_27017 [Oryza sativa Japonica Group]|uniref:Uncharacterized protein n=1 Tax=Oryza sativa subsp. japonica TaxID=39947 RepID=B9G0I2_ORYSJ|nr:hypothetical protein OsJ_27017 [Oryza sativa Japonica Group]
MQKGGESGHGARWDERLWEAGSRGYRWLSLPIASTSSGCWRRCQIGTAHTSITRRSTPLPVCLALPAGCRRASEWMVRRARQRVGEGVRLDNGLADRDWYLPSTIHAVGTISSGVVDVGLEPTLREPLHLSA